MNVENLYTKYKFNKEDLDALCKVLNTNADGVVAKLDAMSYEEQKAIYMLMTVSKQVKNVL